MNLYQGNLSVDVVTHNAPADHHFDDWLKIVRHELGIAAATIERKIKNSDRSNIHTVTVEGDFK